MADLKISQFIPVTDPTDVTLAGYKGLDNVKLSAEVFATGSDIEILANDISDIDIQLEQVNNNISTIQEVIPNTASAANQLVDRDTMNSSITSLAANYVTYTANGDAFATLNDLLTATTVYHGGVAYTPTAKDYATVLVDPTAPAPFTNGTVRRTYDGAVWAYSFGINEQPLTADQLAAVNSNITAAKVATFEGYATSKQDTLTAGENITILNNVISASGGGSGDFIDKMVFINTIRGTVGRNAHKIDTSNTGSYYILSDGIMRGLATFNPAQFVPDANGMILSGIAHISELRGLRISASGSLTIPANFLKGCQYEHFAITRTAPAGDYPVNSVVQNVDFLCDIGLEWFNANCTRLGGNVTINNRTGRSFCNLPNLRYLLIINGGRGSSFLNEDGLTPSLPPERTFVDVKNDSECILYAPSINIGNTMKSVYPGLSNWTVKVLPIII